jgi:hypothetical protein
MPAKAKRKKKRMKLRLGQLVWCRQLGNVTVTGVLDHNLYRRSALVVNRHNDDFFVEPEILQPPKAYDRSPLTPNDQFKKLLLDDPAVYPLI